MSGHLGQTTLYRFYDDYGVLLYIGITDREDKRFREHHQEKTWWWKVSTITVDHYRWREDAIRAEEAAIRAEHPIHNVIHNEVEGDPALLPQNAVARELGLSPLTRAVKYAL